MPPLTTGSAGNLAQPTPWYLKRFFVDGHEYNVVALQVVPRDAQNTQGEDWEFKYITFRTPVPKPYSFVNFQDSLVLQGYFRGAVLDNPDTNVVSVMPPFNVPHTIAEDIVRIPLTDFATSREHPRTDVVGPLRGAGPMQIRIVAESTEPRFTGELRELLFLRDLPLTTAGSKRDIWSTEQFHVYPDRYTEVRLPDDQLYLLTSDWTSPYSRLHFFAFEDTNPAVLGVQNSQNDIAAAWAATNPGQTTAGIPFTNTDGVGPADFPVGTNTGHIDFFNAEDRSVPADPTQARVKFVYSPRDTTDIYVNPGPPQQPCGVSPGTVTPTVTPCSGPNCPATSTPTRTLTPSPTPCTGPGCAPTLTPTATATLCVGPGCAPTLTPTATPTLCLGPGCAPTLTPTATPTTCLGPGCAPTLTSTPTPTRTPTQSPNLGAIVGTVFRDVNCDSIWQGGEPGLSGVLITLIAPGPDNAFGTADDVIVATTTTDANGAYSFPNVAPGSYTVRETDPPGFKSSTPNDVVVSVVVGGVTTVNFGDCLAATSTATPTGTATRTATPCTGPNCPPTLTPTPTLEPSATPTPTRTPTSGTPIVTSTATATRSPNLGAIIGVVFRDMNCNSVWEGGEPGLSGVLITLVAPGPDNAFGTADDVVVATTTTDANGNYSFSNLPPGAYLVRETDPAGFVSSTPNTVVVTVVGGGFAIANFGDCLGLTPTQTLTPTVTPTVCSGPGCPATGTPTLTPTATPTTSPNLGTVRGVVYLDLNCDGVQQGGDTGIPGVTVRLIGAGPDGILGTGDDVVIGTTTTDATGAYIFTNIPAGVYDVRETDPVGYTSSTSNSVIVVVVGGGVAIANFGDCLALTSTPTATPCTGPGCPTTSTPTTTPTVTPTGGPNVGSIIGVVYRDINCDGVQQGGDTGIPGVTITLLGPGPDGLIGTADDIVIATTTTNANGAYAFTNIPTGVYAVRETDLVGYTSSTPNTVLVVVVGGGIAIANFGDCLGGTSTPTLTPTVTPTSTATPTVCVGPNCPATGTPTVTSTVTRTPTPTPTTCVGPGCAPTGTPTLTPTATSTTGPRPGTIIGVVYYDRNCDGARQGGEPGLSGVTITLLATGPDNAFGTADDVIVATTTTDANGAYLFSNVAPGVYMVRETDPAGYISSTPNNVVAVVVDAGLAIANFGDCLSTPTTVTPTPTPTVTPTQSPNLGAIVGVVFRDVNCNSVLEGGEPGLSGVTITLFAPGPDNAFGTADDVVVATTTTDTNGAYSFPNLPPGAYLVRETDPAGYTSSTPNSVIAVVVGGGVAVVNFGDCQTVGPTVTPTPTTTRTPGGPTPTPTTTATPSPSPTAPIYLVVVCEVSSPSITVQWMVVGAFDSFELERTPAFPNGSSIKTISGTLRHVDNDVTPGTSYSYRVRGVLGNERTAWSNTDGCTPTQPSPAPPILDCRTVSASLINVSWQIPDLSAVGIRVERSRNGVNWTQITDQPRGASPYRDSGLQDNTLYFYRGRTYRTPTGPLSDYSTIVSCQTPPRNDDVTGTVLLQGRNNHAGARVLIDRGTAGFAITDDLGAFSIAGTPFGRHTVEIDMAGYLPISRTIEVVSVDTPMGVMNMLAGDANGDLKIDLFDLTIVASAYDIEYGAPGWDNRADINGDGAVDIFDLVLVSQNFDLRGPTNGSLQGKYAGGQATDSQAKTAATATVPTAHARLVNRTPQAAYRHGDRLTVAVELDSLTDFYGGALDLVYDPAVLQVVDMNPAQNGVQVQPGDLFPATAFFAPRDQVVTRPDGKQVVRFAGVRREADPVSGQGVLVEVTFEVQGCGATTLDLAQAHLDVSNPAGEALPVTLDGSVRLGGAFCLFLPLVQNGN
ncbi:MAG: hypothetical protein KIT87_00935 [Anaerolineae bacterium]|nr:hypothetical protein [Anaerolineae bacterium]